MFFSTMIDMAHTPDDVKKELAEMGSPASATPLVGLYPYGLCISLDDETLQKLKLDGELPGVGEMIHLCAMAKVTSVSENEREDSNGGKKVCRRVELQITHLATENEDQEGAAVEERESRQKARQGRFYGGGDKAA